MGYGQFNKVFRLLLCGPSAISDETAQVAKTQRPLSEGRREQLVNRSWLQQKMLIRISLLCNEMFGHQSLRPWGADVPPWIDLPRTRSGRRKDDCRVQRRFRGSGLALLWQIYSRCLRRVRLQWGHR